MKGKSATLLVLVVAAVVLGCFAVKSYFDFQVTKLKHQYEQQGGQAAAAGQASVGTAGAVPPPPGVGITPAPTPTPSAVGEVSVPVPVPPLVSTTPGGNQAATAAEKSEVARIQAELDALRRENALIEQRASKADSAAASSGAAAVGEAAASAAPGTIGGAPPLPSDDPTVLALRQQIIGASAIGKVAAFHKEFDRVTIEGGSERNIRVDDEFAVRRGHEIMGFLTVEEVGQGSSHAVLTSKNAQSETARKPQAGDDVIKWPPL